MIFLEESPGDKALEGVGMQGRWFVFKDHPLPAQGVLLERVRNHAKIPEGLCGSTSCFWPNSKTKKKNREGGSKDR